MDIVVSSCQCYCVPIRISRHPVPYSNTTTLHIKALRNVDQRHYNMPAGRQKKSAARSRRLQEDFRQSMVKVGLRIGDLLEAAAEDWHASYEQSRDAESVARFAVVSDNSETHA